MQARLKSWHSLIRRLPMLTFEYKPSPLSGAALAGLLSASALALPLQSINRGDSEAVITTALGSTGLSASTGKPVPLANTASGWLPSLPLGPAEAEFAQ